MKVFLKWPFDANRPERRCLPESYIDDAEIVINHVEDLEVTPREEGIYKYFNYLKDGFISELLRNNDFIKFCLKDDFSLQSMLYLIYANKNNREIVILSHGIKHSAQSLLMASKRKVVISRLILNIYRYSKLLIDFVLFGIQNANLINCLKVYYWSFRYDHFTYIQKTIGLFRLRFDFYCFNAIDVKIQKKMVLGPTNDNSVINFKIMPFPYHREIVMSDLTIIPGANNVLIILTGSLHISQELLKNFFHFLVRSNTLNVVIKIHPFDYNNSEFINSINLSFGRNVRILKNMSDLQMVCEIQKSKMVYSFYSTVVLPILKQRKLVLIGGAESLEDNPTIKDLWDLGMIDYLNIEQSTLKIKYNNKARNTKLYFYNYGF